MNCFLLFNIFKQEILYEILMIFCELKVQSLKNDDRLAPDNYRSMLYSTSIIKVYEEIISSIGCH